MSLTPKEWKSFQHYKERRPPWIKLHRPLLDNADFQRLPVASRALAPMLWLIAAEYDNGDITASAEDIAWRLRMSAEEFNAALTPLIEREFFSQSDGAIKTLASCEQETPPEREAETQVQTEEEKIGGGEETRARPKSLISESAFETAGKVLVAMGLDPHAPLSVGAPLTIQGWLNERWNPECILIGVKRGMQSRNGDPPGTLKYFEKAIARAHAELTPNLPTVQFREAETLTVTHGKPKSAIIQAADDLCRKIASFDGPARGPDELRGIEGEASARQLSHG